MKIGYACIPLTIKATNNRKILLKNYSEDKLKDLIYKNLNDLKLILKNNKDNNIDLFRISSNIIPLASHDINTFDWKTYFKETLIDIGNYIKSNNIRVSMHADHFVVLNSKDKNVVKNSIDNLNYLCDFLTSLNIDTSNKIILHVGGLYNDKISAKKRFIENFYYLDDKVKDRLTIENDEKKFSIYDVLELSSILNIPVIYDNLHNICHGDNSLSHKEIYNLVLKTWKKTDGNMKVHYSQQDIEKTKGSHSKTIFIDDFLDYYNEIKEFNPDIMLEVKDKDISAIKCINSLKQLSNCLDSNKLLKEFDKYELLILEHTKKLNINNFKSNDIISFYSSLDECLKSPIDDAGYKIALNMCIQRLKPYINSRELSYINVLLAKGNLKNVKIHIGKLADKYNLSYILNSYYMSQ